MPSSSQSVNYYSSLEVPEVLIFSTIQPIMFVLLFRYVFGGSISTGAPGGYIQLLMPGIFVQTVAFTLAATASGLAEDMKKGLIDRFRSLPIARSALVFGRTLGDSTLNIVVLFAMGLTGFIVGWRPVQESSKSRSPLFSFSSSVTRCHGLASLLGYRRAMLEISAERQLSHRLSADIPLECIRTNNGNA
jgi:ABC-type transport system involved in multi-copper enzyme maturation permease subunit